MAAYGADMSKYLENGNEERIRKAYQDRDPRLQMAVITPRMNNITVPHPA